MIPPILTLTWNTSTRALIARPFPVAIKRQEPLRFLLTLDRELDSGAILSLAVRVRGQFDNGPLLTLTGWTKDSALAWHLDETIESDEIDAALAVNSTEADDEISIRCTLDLRAFASDGTTLLAASRSIDCLLQNNEGRDAAVFIEDGGAAQL